MLVPLGFVLRKDLPLCMVADNSDIDEAAQVELLRSEHRHLGCLCNQNRARLDGRDEVVPPSNIV